MSERSVKYGDIYNLHGLGLSLKDIVFPPLTFAYLKRNNITTFQQLLSMNSDILRDEMERNYIAIDGIEETLRELSESSKIEAQDKTHVWDASDEPMVAAAVRRMKLLGLSDEIIEAFERRGEVKVSNQVCICIDPDGDKSDGIRPKGSCIAYKGMLFSCSVLEPAEQQMQRIIEKLERYGECHLIYHVNRLEIRRRAMYTVFYVDTYEDGWENDEREISNGEPWGYVAYMGDENWQWADYVKISVESVMGYVFRTDLPTYKEETLRFVKKYESDEMREFLHSHPDILSRTNCAKIVAFAPDPLELKIPVLQLIAEQTEPCPDDEDYDPSVAAKAFCAALDERYENNPPGTVFMLQHRWFNEYDAPSFGYGYRGVWRLFTEFDAAMEYIVEEMPRRLAEEHFYEAWYEVTKCVPGEYSEMDQDFSWVIDAAGEILSFEGSTEFLKRHGFLRQPDHLLGETIWDVDKPDNLRFCRPWIGIPTPFQPGDLVWIDCRPFSKKRHIVISSNDGESAKCINIHNEKVYSVSIEGISAGGKIKDAETLLSPLYRAEVDESDVHDVRVKGREYPAMKTISAAIKANPEIGIEMEKYILGDGPFYNHGGAQWDDFKEKFGLTKRTDAE